MSQPEPEAEEDHGPAQELTFQSRLVRVEALSAAEPDSRGIDWTVHYFRFNRSSYVAIVASAYLRVGTDEAWAQALVVGHLLVRNTLLERSGMAPEEFLRGFVEEMYDVARRTFNQLMAQMDGPSLNVPEQSPETELIEVDPAELEDDAEDSSDDDGASLQG